MLTRRLPVLLIAVLGAVTLVHAQGPIVAIVGGTVIDGNGGAPLPDSVLLVEGERITAVGPSSAIRVPAGAQIVEANGKAGRLVDREALPQVRVLSAPRSPTRTTQSQP